jgi:hypothetical protein
MFEQVMDESWILVWEVWDIAESRGAAAELFAELFACSVYMCLWSSFGRTIS